MLILLMCVSGVWGSGLLGSSPLTLKKLTEGGTMEREYTGGGRGGSGRTNDAISKSFRRPVRPYILQTAEMFPTGVPF